VDKIEKTDKEWKEELSAEEYRILRKKGTEAPFSGEYDKTFEDGMYKCAGCGVELFDSSHKYDSGCGWPAFDDSLPGAVTYTEDNTLGMKRIEITCTKCGGHLGHVFPDGPKNTTGKRFCVNSKSLKFNKSVI
jgi:peptide-methionine (R)-S-oxide reductase